MLSFHTPESLARKSGQEVVSAVQSVQGSDRFRDFRSAERFVLCEVSMVKRSEVRVDE